MNIKELNLAPREQRTLESQGFDTLEKIALCRRDDLGMSKSKGDEIIQRVWNTLASRNVQKVTFNGDQIKLNLTDTNEAILASIRGILGIFDEFKQEIQDNNLIIFKPSKKRCRCGTIGKYLCKQCGVELCDKCRFGHEHTNIIDIEYLENRFEFVKQNASRLASLKQTKPVINGSAANEEIVEFGRKLGFTGFIEAFFTELEGNNVLKRAIVCSLFSSPSEPVHTLVIGDPGGGKTMARDIITRKLGQEIALIGANSTRSGLVCNLATGERGELTYADGKVVLADEFDKIPERDLDYCLELLSNGKCSIHSARVHETIEAHFVMIAFANPTNTVFAKDPLKEIGLSAALISRFAVVVKAETLDAEHRKALLRKKLLGEKLRTENVDFILPCIIKARTFDPQFILSEHEISRYIEKVDSLVGKHQESSLRRDMRMGDYAKRVPTAIARANFTDVDGKVLDQAVQLFEDSIAMWL